MGRRSTIPGPYGFFASPDGSLRLNEAGIAKLSEWYKENPNPWRLVKHAMAGMYQKLIYHNFTHDDIDSIGLKAATEAMVRYIPEKAEFSTFFCWWIKSETQGQLRVFTKNQNYGICVHSIDADVNENGSSILNVIGKNDDELATVESGSAKTILDTHLANVSSERNREILKMYYGINRSVRFTLAQIAESFDLSKERVRQIVEISMREIRSSITTDHEI